MARIRHIAIQTQDEEATKTFYVENFGLKVVKKLENDRIAGYYLTDDHINVAVLRFKNDVLAGAERGKGWSGIHHIGFQVDSLEETAAKLTHTVATPRDDINVALGLGAGGPWQRRGAVYRARQRQFRRLRNRLGRNPEQQSPRLSAAIAAQSRTTDARPQPRLSADGQRAAAAIVQPVPTKEICHAHLYARLRTNLLRGGRLRLSVVGHSRRRVERDNRLLVGKDAFQSDGRAEGPVPLHHDGSAERHRRQILRSRRGRPAVGCVCRRPARIDGSLSLFYSP